MIELKLQFAILCMLVMLFSCENKPVPVDVAVNCYPTIDQLQGHYNEEEAIWENPDSTFSQYISFDGQDYASFSRVDQDGNSLGIGLIDKTGKVRVQPIYTGSISVGFVNGLCEVGDSSGRMGLVNEQGIEVLAPIYESVTINYRELDPDMILVKKDGKWGIVNPKGEVVVAIQYEALELAGEKRLMFMSEPQKWGIMDYNSTVIVEPIFTHTNVFKNGKTRLQKADGENYTVYTDGRIEIAD